MPPLHGDPRPGPQEPADRVERPRAAPDRRGHRRPGDAELRKGPEAEDEAGSEHDVDRVRQPEDAHRDRGVSGSAKDRVDDEEDDDGRLAAQHHARIAGPHLEHRGRGAHEREQPRSEGHPQPTEEDGTGDSERRRLHGGVRRAVPVLLANPACDDGGRPDSEPHRQGVDQREHRLGEPDGGNRIWPQTTDEEHVGDREDALHRHLQHHGDGEEEDGAADGSSSVILFRAAQRLADVRPESFAGRG